MGRGTDMQYVTLNNGLNMPQLGFGVWQVEEEKIDRVVQKAFDVGFRSIDTAPVYNNEEGVGRAIAGSGLPRQDIFVTAKVRNIDHGYQNTIAALENSLEKMGLDYVDLYLIHWPMPAFNKYIETYQAMETLYKDGLTRAIGVCNFDIDHLQRLLHKCEVIPVVNQVECHPYLQQKEMKAFCKAQNIHLEAWSPLMQGGEVLVDKVISEIADKYNKTAAQVIIRWHLQSDTIVIPKSVTDFRIEENFHVFDFKLSEEDMEKIAALDRNWRKGPQPTNMNVLE